jgi:hypothetical protein
MLGHVQNRGINNFIEISVCFYRKRAGIRGPHANLHQVSILNKISHLRLEIHLSVSKALMEIGVWVIYSNTICAICQHLCICELYAPDFVKPDRGRDKAVYCMQDVLTKVSCIECTVFCLAEPNKKLLLNTKKTKYEICNFQVWYLTALYLVESNFIFTTVGLWRANYIFPAERD